MVYPYDYVAEHVCKGALVLILQGNILPWN